MAQAPGSPETPAPKSSGNGAGAKKERPRYQLLQTAYINDTLLEPDRQPMIDDPDNPGEQIRRPLYIVYDGEPGGHMKPVNAAAKEMYRRHPPRDLDPISKLTLIGPEAEVIPPSRPTA